MSQYTDDLEFQYSNLSPDDANYTEELLEIAASFRTFDSALDEFFQSHGYSGSMDSNTGKIAFIKEKFDKSGIEPPRNLSRYYTEHIRIERYTAFKFCFAFGLNIEQTNDFFRRICLERSFDCHNIEEAIYYYAISNTLSYEQAQSIINKAPKADKSKYDINSEVLYTSTIVKEINRIKNADELLLYFENNISQFGYNHVSANKNISALWDKISGENGLAARERNSLILEKSSKSKSLNTSIWKIYLQILGVDKISAGALHTDRSLKPILKDNKLLHSLAADSFPDRDGITKILNKEHVSHERTRKIIILLSFYVFWVTLALDRKDGTYQAKELDADRCQSQINHLLVDSGYDELYLGNPYDWIFMFTLKDEYPLETFREFILELNLYKGEEND
ncbi:MAG: hypothetical protein K2K41_02260 [Ruminiclostridium sp.]|nr:hypothetical protein [Ruminiclostridium sp.]MDE6724843.1 hypothetical protein [Ruminiclostridium sp.]